MMKKRLTKYGVCLLALLLFFGCIAPIELLHNAHKDQNTEKVGSFALEEKQKDPSIRREAVKLLADYSYKEVSLYLEKTATDSNSLVRAQTAKTLGTFQAPETKPILIKLSNDPQPKVKAWAIRGLAEIVKPTESNFIHNFRKNLESDSIELKLATAEFLARMGKEDGHMETIQTLEAPYYTQVRQAIQTLKYFKNKKDIRYLKKFLISKDPITRRKAVESMEYILGKKLDEETLAKLQGDASELSYALSAGEAKKEIKEKPSIYTAYPKGNEKIADESIEFIGYITSENRTENLEILVNNNPISVDQLWADFKVDYKGLRGFPLKLKIPLAFGGNKIDINVRDKAGYLVNHSVTVKRIKLVETASVSRRKPESTQPPPARLKNIQIEKHSGEVTPENFMSIIEDWVLQTAYSDYNKGNSMFDQGRFERADYYYRKSIKTNPFAQAYYNLGITQKTLGKTSEAQLVFSKACEMNEPKGCRMLK